MCFFDWLPATEILNTKRWEEAILAHDRKIAELTTLGARGVVGTRPILNQNGSRRNQAYVWSTETETALPLPIYEKRGWDPAKKNKTEREELDLRRNFAVKKLASKSLLALLDKLSSDYEKKHLNDLI
jgi:hypothetical protein